MAQEVTTWFALHGVAIYIFVSFLMFLTALGIGALTPFLEAFSRWLVIVLVAGGVATAVVLFVCLNGRLSLILPATAIDRRPAKDWMDWAWAKSGGNDWPLTVLLGIMPLFGWAVVNLITDVMVDHAKQGSVPLASLMFVLAWWLFFFVTILQVTVLSLSLKQLSTDGGEGNPATVD